MSSIQPKIFCSLDELADTNPESLSSTTDRNFNFRYVDLGATNVGAIRWNSVAEVSYATSPSRARRVLRAGDVLFGTVRPNLQSHGYFDGAILGPVVASTGFSVIRAKSGVSDSRYLFHCVMSSQIAIQANRDAVGSSYPALSDGDVRRFEVFSPPIAEQVAIAEILDTLDSTIRQTEAIIEKLKQVKQGLLHDLLTRGIDTNGELRPPQSQASNLYKDSMLGWIPKEWNCVPTATRCSLITKGTTPAADDMWQGEDGIRFLRVDNLSFDGKFDLLASRFRVGPFTHNGVLNRSRCLPGDILTNIVGPPLGKLGLVTVETGKVNINQAIALYRPSVELSSGFLLLWLSSSAAQSWLRSRAKQTSGQLNLTLALCQELPIPDISLDEQQRIVDAFGTAQNRINLEACELVKLSSLKGGLMDDLLTGRVRIAPLLDTLDD